MLRVCGLAVVVGLVQLACLHDLHAEVRTWTDNTGKHKREGDFVKVEAGKVVLRDKDGKTVPIPFDRLCTLDQDYVVAVSRQRGGDPRAVVRERASGGRWALLVGVNKYDKLTSLQFAARDMLQLQAKLVNLGFPEKQIVVLTDAATEESSRPTKKNIEAWLERLLAGRVTTSQERTVIEPRLVGQADQIVVAFSGHGVQLSGESYFCPGEADVKRAAETMVSMRSVYGRLASVSSGLRFLLVDACRNSPGESPDQPKALEIDRAQLPVGIVALSSCSAGQTSLEHERLGQGVFSYYLQAGLGGAAGTPDASGNVEVRLNQLATYVIDKTEGYAQGILEGQQTPHLVASIEGNPILGVVQKDRVVRADPEIASTRPGGPRAAGYAINLHNVTAPDLPEGWTGPGGLVTADVAGRRMLKSNADKPVTAVSPPIKIQGDFFLELEIGHADGEQPFNVKLLGDDGERDFEVMFQLGGGYWYFTLPELAKRYGETPLDATSRGVPTRVRLERRGTQYIVSFQCDKTRQFAYRYDAYKNFKGLEIMLPPGGIAIYDLHVGPLGSKAPTGVTAEYKPEIPRDRMPAGWRLAGQPLNGAARILGPADTIDVRGDFYFAVRAATVDDSLFTITLLGRDGKRSLPLTARLNGGYLYVSLPQTEHSYYKVPDARNGFTLRLERRDGAMALVVNSEEVKQVLHDDGFCDFDGLQFDVWKGSCAISQMALGPLGVAAEPAEEPEN